MTATKKAAVTLGSRDVFKDLELRSRDELLAKAQVASNIFQILEKRKLTQTQAAKLLGADLPKVSQIYRGRLDDFSLERLPRLPTKLHRDVRIIVADKPRRGWGRVTVEAAREASPNVNSSRRSSLISPGGRQLGGR
jgi:predicted XRE-type DNA-binding protein